MEFNHHLYVKSMEASNSIEIIAFDANTPTVTLVRFVSSTLTENRTKIRWVRKETQEINCELNSSSPRSISIGQLNTLPCLHLRPIKLVVCKWPYLIKLGGISYLEACFTLRCLQRLSLPHAATQLCTWQYNWCTGGASDPVLSY